MTQQIEDRFDLNGESFEFIDAVPAIDFMASIELEPRWMASECWRGYVVVYAIAHGRLVIRDLLINLVDDDLSPVEGPVINGVTPRITEPDCSFNNNYFLIDFPIAYTGEMLIARDFDVLRARYSASAKLRFEDGAALEISFGTEGVVTRINGRPVLSGQILTGIALRKAADCLVIDVGNGIEFHVTVDMSSPDVGDVVQFVVEGYDEDTTTFVGRLLGGRNP